MKKKNYFVPLTVLFLALTLVVGCSKDDDEDAGPSNGASITATINGASWSSLSSRSGAAFVGGVFNLSGVKSDSTMITITINEDVEVGYVYFLDQFSNGAGVYASNTTGSTPSWTSNSHDSCWGFLTVTSKDTVNKKITGVFEYKAWRASDNSFKEVTNGTFTNVPYVTSITSTGSNTFAVKVDGVDFVPAIISGSIAFGELHLVASDNMGSKSVGLVMPETITAGTYSIGSFGSTYYGQYNPNSSTFTISSSGSLTISSHNTTTNTIAGTFNFSSQPITGGPPVYSLTNGSFSITY